MGSFFAVNSRVLGNVRLFAFAGLAVLFVISDPLVRLVVEPVVYSSIVVYLSVSACRGLNIGRWGDISYGIYLYHFPIIQLLIYLGAFEYNVWVGLFAVLVVTLIAAIASWHLVEKGLLRRSSYHVVAGG